MKSLKILQISDIHYPQYKDSLISDIKDKSVSKALVQSAAPKIMQIVMRKVTQIISDGEIDSLLVCGDISSFGKDEDYLVSVDYLDKVVEISNTNKWPDNKIHVVPGNHDVDRTKIDPDEENLYKKFDALKTKWKDIGREDLLAVDSVRSTEISNGKNSARIYSMNSCMGCGVTKFLPSKIQDELAEIMNTLIEDEDELPEDVFSLVGNQLDTPAFDHDHIDELVRQINTQDEKVVPIVMAHHNVLNQAVPRWEIYTELINSGIFRSQLASCSRTILYCHGHIHSDIIEELTDHKYPSSRIIFISAPLFIEGFNIIELQYSHDEYPLGCIIHQYRSSKHGSVDKVNQVRICLYSENNRVKYLNEKNSALLQVIGEKTMRFKNIRDSIELKSKPNIDTLKNIILEAEWLNLIQVIDKDHGVKNWKIRRIGK